MEDAIGLEDLGESLNFRMQHEGKTAVVRISREAMEDHFGAEPGTTLAMAYLANPGAVHDRVRAKLVPGIHYTRMAPLVIRTDDL